MNVSRLVTATGLLSALLLTGCLSGGGGGSDGGGDVAGPDTGGGETPGGAPQSVSFSTLVQDIFARTSDTAEPTAINGLEIVFDDQDNENAFDDLL